MPKLDEYLHITEAAELLGVWRNTLRNWGRTGQIEEHRHPINKYRLYKWVVLERLLRKTEASVRSIKKSSLTNGST